MKKKKGFTLIELLAVIIILAVIALIAVPQVLKILNKSRLAAAEDSVYGVVGATNSYIGNLMLKNNGSYPKIDLEFECNGSCKLSDEVKTKLQNYDLTGLEELNFKGSNPNGGRVIITNGGKITIVKNLEINGFICSYPIGGKVKCVKIGEELEEPDIPEPPKPEIINITLTFNAMGGSVNIDSKEVTYNEEYGELPTPIRENYTFVGWYTMPTYTNKVTSESIVKTIENQTLYAKWAGVITTVNFNANGGIGDTSSKTVTYGEKYGELPNVTREGYKFNGWYTENNGGTIITKDTIVSINTEQTLYAHWIGENSTVTFNAMGGSASPTSIEVTYNEKYGELATPTRTGYIFGGWYTLPTCLEANKITSESIVKTIENQTLYAKWTEEVCNNITKSVTCTKTCVNGTNASGTRVDTYNCRGNLVSTGVCNATCSNYTKTNSCSIKCGSGNVSGTRVDTYNGNTGSLISTGTCNATCPAGPSGATLTVTSGPVNNYNTTYVTLKSTVTSGATISKYEFYNGSNLLGTKTTSSKSTSITVNTLTLGNMSFRVVVTDIYGRTATSSVTESCSPSSVEDNCTLIYKCTNSNRQYGLTNTQICNACPNPSQEDCSGCDIGSRHFGRSCGGGFSGSVSITIYCYNGNNIGSTSSNTCRPS